MERTANSIPKVCGSKSLLQALEILLSDRTFFWVLLKQKRRKDNGNDCKIYRKQAEKER